MDLIRLNVVRTEENGLVAVTDHLGPFINYSSLGIRPTDARPKGVRSGGYAYAVESAIELEEAKKRLRQWAEGLRAVRVIVVDMRRDVKPNALRSELRKQQLVLFEENGVNVLYVPTPPGVEDQQVVNYVQLALRRAECRSTLLSSSDGRKRAFLIER